jgi:hypothetical protein
MGDWCSKADTECNENLRCGEEMVADDERRKKLFLRTDYYGLLTGWPLMGDPVDLMSPVYDLGSAPD